MPHYTGKFASTVEPDASLAVISICWLPVCVPHATARLEPARRAALEREALGRAVVVRDEHLGIVEASVDDRVELERAAGGHRCAESARSSTPEPCSANTIAPVPSGVALDRADADPRGRAIAEDLGEPRLQLLDDRLGRVDVAPHDEQVRRRLDDAVALERELDERVADDALLRHDLRELGARAKQPRIGDRHRHVRVRRGLAHRRDHRVAERRVRGGACSGSL